MSKANVTRNGGNVILVFDYEDEEGEIVDVRQPMTVSQARDLASRLIRMAHDSECYLNSINGHNELRATVLGEGRATVQCRGAVTVFSEHTKSGRGRWTTRACGACRGPIVPGDTYWREADSVERKTFSGEMFCAPCVRPELRAAALLKQVTP